MPDLPSDARLPWPDLQNAVPVALSRRIGMRETPRIDVSGGISILQGGQLELFQYQKGRTPPGSRDPVNPNPSFEQNAVTVSGDGVLFVVGVRVTGGGHAFRIMNHARVCFIDCTFEGQAYDPISRYDSGGIVGAYRTTFRRFGIDYPMQPEPNPTNAKQSSAHALYVRGPAGGECLDCTFVDGDIDGWPIQLKNMDTPGWQAPFYARRLTIQRCLGTLYAYQHVQPDFDECTQEGGRRTVVLRAHRGHVHVTRFLTPAEAAGTVETVTHFKKGIRGSEPWVQSTPAVTLIVPENIPSITHRYGIDMTAGGGMDGDRTETLSVPHGGVVRTVHTSNATPPPDPQPQPDETLSEQTYPLRRTDATGLSWRLREHLGTAVIQTGSWGATDQGGQAVNTLVKSDQDRVIGDTTPNTYIGGNFASWVQDGDQVCTTVAPVETLTLTLQGSNLPDPLGEPDPVDVQVVTLESISRKLDALAKEVDEIKNLLNQQGGS